MDGCLLIFDLTKRYSLYQCTVEALTRWKGVLQRELVDKESSLELVNIPIPIILVGTKVKLYAQLLVYYYNCVYLYPLQFYLPMQVVSN